MHSIFLGILLTQSIAWFLVIHGVNARLFKMPFPTPTQVPTTGSEQTQFVWNRLEDLTQAGVPNLSNSTHPEARVLCTPLRYKMPFDLSCSRIAHKHTFSTIDEYSL